jgi:hypothetical protein
VSAIIKAAIGILTDGIIPAIRAVAEYIRLHSGGIVAGIQSVIKGVVDFTQGLFQAVLALIHGNWQELLNSLGKMVTGLGEILKPSGDMLVHFLDQTIGRAFAGIWQIGSRAGTDLINGLSDGVAQGAAHFQDTLAWVANNAINTAKNILGIRSPSTVFRDEIGQHITGGMAEGVRMRQNDMTSAVKSVGGAAIGAMAPAGNSSSITFATGSIQITGAPGQDVSALADAVMARIQQRLAGRY